MTSTIPHTRYTQDETCVSERYEVGEKIGQGTFGKVYSAVHRESGKLWAIKSINKEKAGSSAVKLIEREVAILKLVKHPNIIQLNEVLETAKTMYLVMELCQEGELADALKEKKRYSEDDAKTIIKRLASAISYLHKIDIVHRDIKLENILLSENPEDSNDKLHIKVTDFGLSVVKGGLGHESMLQDFCGTPMYMAPEILDNKAYSQQCDVWAMGVIMYIVLCGEAPFFSNDETNLYEIIKKGEVDFSNEIWTNISDEAKSCINRMLKVDPAHRMSAAEVLDHPWMTGDTQDTNRPVNVLEMMKEWAPQLKKGGNYDSDEDSAINGDSTDGLNKEESLTQETSVPIVVVSSEADKNIMRKGSGGVKRVSGSPNPGGKLVGAAARHSKSGGLKLTVSTSSKQTSSTHSLKAGSPSGRALTPSGSSTGKRTPNATSDKNLSTRKPKK